MRTERFTETEITKILKEYESGIDALFICRVHGISRETLYNWHKSYSGLESYREKRLKELEEENNKLKQMYADISLDNIMLKDLLEKNFDALR